MTHVFSELGSDRRFHEVLNKMKQEYGDIMTLYFGKSKEL